MSHLRLATLGPPEIAHAGQPVSFRTRKALALLVYLAVEGGMHARESLIALFWPDADEAGGRMILRRTLADLRQALDEAGALPGQTHLLVERDALGFNTAAESALDLQTLQAAVKDTPRGAPDGPAAREQWQRAVALCRGGFLAG